MDPVNCLSPETLAYVQDCVDIGDMKPAATNQNRSPYPLSPAPVFRLDMSSPSNSPADDPLNFPAGESIL
jgi:hypothetical protein